MQGMVIGKEELNVICGRATQSFDDVATHTHCSHHGGGSGKSNNVSPNSSPVRQQGDFKACPCCRRYIENFDHPVTPGSVETSSTTLDQLQQLQRSSPQKSNNSGDNMEVDEEDTEEYGSWNLQRSMLTSTMGSSLMSLFNGGLDDLNQEEDEFNMSAPPLVQGDKVQHYTITETIVQGWLYKKGSGNDIWGRRWWKPRWVTFVVSAPLLLCPVCFVLHACAYHTRFMHLTNVNPSMNTNLNSWQYIQDNQYPCHSSSHTTHQVYPSQLTSWN